MGQVSGEYPQNSAIVVGTAWRDVEISGWRLRCDAAVAVLPERARSVAEVEFDAGAGDGAGYIELRLGDELGVHAFALNRSNDAAGPSLSNERMG